MIGWNYISYILIGSIENELWTLTWEPWWYNCLPIKWIGNDFDNMVFFNRPKDRDLFRITYLNDELFIRIEGVKCRWNEVGNNCVCTYSYVFTILILYSFSKFILLFSFYTYFIDGHLFYLLGVFKLLLLLVWHYVKWTHIFFFFQRNFNVPYFYVLQKRILDLFSLTEELLKRNF